LMALYSGARLGELAQLLTDDVKQVDGHWVFHITEEGCTAKTTKTKGSERIVPIHSQLINLGFLDFHLERVLSEERRLFPEIIADKRGQISGRPSKWFGKYLKKMKLKDGTRLKFHSFRHTAIDALRRAGYTNEEMSPLWGHSQPGMTARYGSEAVLTVGQRKKMIEDISYDIDLSHLKHQGSLLQAA
jgi:integrase